MDTAATVTLLVTIDRVSSSINIYDFVNEAPKTKPNNSPYNQRFWPTNDGLWNDGVVSCMWHMAHDLINNTQLLNEAEKEALMITSNFRPSTTFDTNSQFTILTTHDVINTRALKSVRTIKFRGINNPSPLSFWSAHHPQSSIWTFMQLPKTNVMTDCALFVARLLAAASLYHTLSGGLSLLASEKYVWNNDEQHVKCVTKYEIDSDTGSCPACLRALDMLYSRMDTFAKKRFDKTQQLARQNQQKAKGLAANATSKKRKNITPDLVPKDKDVSVTTQNSTHTVKEKRHRQVVQQHVVNSLNTRRAQLYRNTIFRLKMRRKKTRLTMKILMSIIPRRHHRHHQRRWNRRRKTAMTMAIMTIWSLHLKTLPLTIMMTMMMITTMMTMRNTMTMNPTMTVTH